jgi:hypothetical protein
LARLVVAALVVTNALFAALLLVAGGVVALVVGATVGAVLAGATVGTVPAGVDLALGSLAGRASGAAPGGRTVLPTGADSRV